MADADSYEARVRQAIDQARALTRLYQSAIDPGLNERLGGIEDSLILLAQGLDQQRDQRREEQ